jgi:hypothetical protein
LFLQLLGNGAIDLEDLHVGERPLASIGVRIEAGPEDDDLGGAVRNRALEGFVDEARPDRHHAHVEDDLDVAHRFVVTEAQRPDGRVIQFELRRIAE